MRMSKGALLVVLALLAPLLVELRVVAGWFGIELTVVQTVLIGLSLVGVVLAYAFWPESDASSGGSTTEGNRSKPSHDASRSD